MSIHVNSPRRARTTFVSVVLAALTLSVASPSGASFGAPTITSPANGDVIGSSLTVTGTADDGTTVTVYEGGLELGSATVASGAWSVTATLADGTHTIHATATDGIITSAPSASVTFDVDSARPAVDVTSPENDHVFTAGDPVTLEGTASDSRALFRVRIEYWTLGAMDRARLADCPACESGATSAAWSHQPSLPPGEWLAKIWSIDQAGNYSLQRSVRFVNLGSDVGFEEPTLPLPDELVIPQITEPGGGEVVPGASEPIVIGGTGDRTALIEVYEEVDGLGKVGGGIETDNDGSWKLRLRLPDGDYGFRARSVDEHGNVSDLSELLEFTVDGYRPVPHIITSTNTVFLPTEQVVLEGTVTDNREAATVIVEYYDHRGKLVLRDVATCDGCPSPEATWRHEPALPFGPGTYTAKVYAYDVAGNGSHIHQISFIKTL